MTKVLLVANMKGGCSKSTTAISSAGALPGKTAILDLDPQRTAFEWTKFREAIGVSPPIYAAMVTEDNLGSYLDKARRGGISWCVIDTAPHSDSAILTAAKFADVIFIPTLVNIADVRAVKTTIRLLKGCSAPQFVILNCVRTIFGFPARKKQAVDAIRKFGGNVSDVFVPDTVKFPDAQASGKTIIEFAPHSGAADQVRALANLAISSVGA